MRATLTGLSILVLAAAGLQACKKEEGKGGKAKVHVKVIRAEKSIVGASVKIKYGAESFPGETAAYEETLTTDMLAGCSFEDLRRGDYYFYATYTDTVYDTTYYGGIHVYVNNPSEFHTVIDFAEADPY